MNVKLLPRLYAAGVFLVTLIIYWMTVHPSVSFWDCGEFIAASYYLQVPHPPGAPFFLILGNISSKIPFFENVGFKVNLISVFSSALTVFFLYLVAVKLINIFNGKKPETFSEALVTYTAASIGALSLAFSDTFWFNGVEAEVYAFSTLSVALIVYLIIRWYERADNKDSEKYILGIAFLVGLSIGVHLICKAFRGLNTKANRTAIDDNEFSWIENAQPIGSGNIKISHLVEESVRQGRALLTQAGDHIVE